MAALLVAAVQGYGVAPISAPAWGFTSRLWEGSLAHTTGYLAEEERADCFNALTMATRVHHGQDRRDGTPFVTHPVAVANLVASWGMDSKCVCAALLHDSVEDTSLTFGEIEEEFGKEVCSLVQGVTRVSKLPEEKVREMHLMGFGGFCRESGDLLRLLDACAGDWRIAVLKVADRLHNMRTLQAMKPHKRARKAQETARVFVPLAHYLGAHEVGTELAALAARHAADDAPPHTRLWAGAVQHVTVLAPKPLRSAAKLLGLDGAPPRLAPSSSIRLRNLVTEIDADTFRASSLVTRLQPLHERFARHRYVHMGAGELAEEAGLREPSAAGEAK